jgi:hypothetical protein
MYVKQQKQHHHIKILTTCKFEMTCKFNLKKDSEIELIQLMFSFL